MKKILILKIIFLFSLFSCQPVEILDKVVFDNKQLLEISINAKQKIINQVYEIKYIEPYIDYVITTPPVKRLNNWLNENI